MWQLFSGSSRGFLGDHFCGFFIGKPFARFEVVKLAGFRVFHEVAQAQGPFFDHAGEVLDNAFARLVQFVHWNPHVDMVRYMYEDPVYEEVEPGRGVEDGGSFHLSLVLGPFFAFAPLDGFGDVMHVYYPTNDITEEHEGDHEKFAPKPECSEKRTVLRPSERKKRGGGNKGKAPNNPRVTLYATDPFFWRGEEHHFSPPDFPQVVDPSAGRRPFDLVHAFRCR